MSDKPMNMTEHFSELRRRIIIVGIGILITFIIGFFVSKPIIVYLQQSYLDLAEGNQLNYFRVTDPINIYIEIAFVIGIILASPVILYQLWAFISPGLYKNERKVTLSFIPLMVILFLLGIAFSYFILFPYVLYFMASLSQDLHINNMIGINEYFHFLLQITLPFGFVFELPILVMFLTRLGILTPHFLSKVRKYAYFIMLIVAGLITPPDVISQIIVMIPLVILYEFSLVISRFAYKRMLRSLQNHEY